MSKRENIYIIKNELSKINRRIEAKIILGYSYARDAKRHKMLLQTLNKIQNRNQYSWFRSLIFSI